MIWETKKSKICSQQAGNPGEPMYSSMLKASRPETQEELMFQFKAKEWKKNNL